MAKRRKHGKGFVDNVKSTFSGIVEGAKSANKFLRDTKAISRGTRLLSQLPTPVSSVFSNISSASDALGYGRKSGRGIMLIEPLSSKISPGKIKI